MAARRVDTYLTWGEPPGAVADKIDRVQRLAARAGRTLEYGIRLHVITRDTAEEAWREAERMLERLPSDTVAQIQAGLARSESEGQRRMLALHGGRRDNLEVHPNLWAGVGLARGGAGTALVGSHTEVADRIEEYHRLGVTEFILSGHPHLEEAYWFGEGVLPLLQRRGLWRHPVAESGEASASVPFVDAPRSPAATT